MFVLFNYKHGLYILLFHIGVELINYCYVRSSVQQSVSVVHIHVSILFQILFPFRLLQNIWQSAQCYTISLCWLSILNTEVCACSVAQPCLTLCHPMSCSPPGSSVPGMLQARIVEWVATPFSRGSSQPRDRIQVSCVSCIAGGNLYC